MDNPVLSSRDFGVFDGAERIGDDAQARDTERHETSGLGVHEREEDGFVVESIVTVVYDVHCANVQLAEPLEVSVESFHDLVVSERALERVVEEGWRDLRAVISSRPLLMAYRSNLGAFAPPSIASSCELHALTQQLMPTSALQNFSRSDRPR